MKKYFPFFFLLIFIELSYGQNVDRDSIIKIDNFKKFKRKYDIDNQLEKDGKTTYPSNWISLKQPSIEWIREYTQLNLPEEYNINNQSITIWVRNGVYLQRFIDLISKSQIREVDASALTDKQCIDYLVAYFELYKSKASLYASPRDIDKIGAQACVCKEDNWVKGDFTNDRFANNIIKFFTGKRLENYGRKGGKVSNDGALDGYYPPRVTRDGSGWNLMPKGFQAREKH